MPDLIIKPTAGAGNKLILQDQGGEDIVTAADSGLILGGTSKPSSPSAGATYFNTTLNAACVYDGTMWRVLGGGPSGGIIHEYVVSSVSYRSHTFLNGESSFYLPVTTTIDVLMVGGGGSGGLAGNNYGAGGGAGGMIVRPSRSTTTGSYAIVVGEGGIGPSGLQGRNTTFYNTRASGMNGYSTTAFGMTAFRGGCGGRHEVAGLPGGSGGGGGIHSGVRTGGAGTQTTEGSISAESKTYGFGNAGGTVLASGTGSTGKCGSGGGAGSVGNFYRGEEFVPTSGQEHYDNGFIGGDGKTNDYRTGVDQWYACGGGSAGWAINTSRATINGTYTGLETGVGGYGSQYPSGCGNCLDARTVPDIRKRAGAQPGTPHTGNGGGGGAIHYYDTEGGNTDGGDGGSGIVVIRYSI